MRSQQINRMLLRLLVIIVSILSIHKNYGQGPNAPEAASFEPVDATDMVNLNTGGLSYVLPLLNVPSPEGGYPLALSYHAGIAMDQESTWLGLGWNLNPGTINRGVNGFPDDWDKTDYTEFFFDEGWTEEYYQVGFGVTFNNAVSVGVGVSWGSNQSVGGHIYLGYGFGGMGNASAGITIGTDGFGISGGGYGINASISTNGIGVGYSIQGKDSSTSLGLGLNYSYSSGLSGDISLRENVGGLKSAVRSHSVGVSFSSKGVNFYGKINGRGAGVTGLGSSINAGDYTVNTSEGGIQIPIYMFYISFGHQRIDYSLYKKNIINTSGILYPIEANELQRYDNSLQLSRSLEYNSLMDVNMLQRFDIRTDDYDDLITPSTIETIGKNNLVLPNYDNYTVTAQGLSGSMTPYFNSELLLSGRGKEPNSENYAYSYLNHSYEEYNLPPSAGGPIVNYDAIRKVNFTFNNVYNSFLRHDRTNFFNNSFGSMTDHVLLENIATSETYSYSDNLSLTGRKKREANSIITYTNEEIRSGVLGFIEAKSINRQEDLDVFLDSGIGAYQITTPDGKTYHYSLPVYQFESTHKNFKNVNNEDENFFEINKNKPYATHWLLTAITGPDYFDKNNNGILDENDYGYWVEFDYGKWSDNYAWKSSNGRLEENYGYKNPNSKSYSYSFGYKQIYYLDAIKTRTHTALFVKNIKEDNKSEEILKYQHLVDYDNNIDGFSPLHHSKVYNSNQRERISHENLGNVFVDGFLYSKEKTVFSKLSTHDYLDIPSSKGLRLEKILLLKNDDLAEMNISKSHSGTNLADVLTGYSSKAVRRRKSYETRYYLVNQDGGTSSTPPYPSGSLISSGSSGADYLYGENLKLRLAQFDQNVLDIKDIEGMNVELKAQQIIEFEHDYQLAKSSPRSDASQAGRLTLNKVYFKGKKGDLLVPPYQFYYNDEDVHFNEDNIDAWGYHDTDPDVWSLKEIVTPIGQKIKLEYEPNQYFTAINHEITFKKGSNEKYRIEKEGSGYQPQSFIITSDEDLGILINDELELRYDKRFMLEDPSNCGGPCGVDEIGYCEFEGTVIVTHDLSVGSEYRYRLSFMPGQGVTCLDENGNTNPNDFYYDEVNESLLYAKYKINNAILGGGIRTKSIVVNDGVDDILKSEYLYNDPITNESSGMSTYFPSKEEKGVPYVSELPPPMVLYKHVKLVNRDKFNTLMGSTAYEFEGLEKSREEPGYLFSLGDAFKVREDQEANFNSNQVKVNKFTIINNLGILGRPKSVISYNSENQILKKTVNTYKIDLDGNYEIGVTQETHKSAKRVRNHTDGSLTFYFGATSKITYPSALQSTTIDQNNYKKTVHYTEHDFLTGNVIETLTEDSDGNQLKSKVIPAYTISDYNPAVGYGMGSKIDDNTNKNMLSQTAAQYTYIKNPITDEWKITNVGITTWNNLWRYPNSTEVNLEVPLFSNEKIWRKHKVFFWDGELNPDGTYKDFGAGHDNFNWSLGQIGYDNGYAEFNDAEQTNSKWKHISTTTLYDHFSAPLETRDINDNYVSTKMTDKNSKTLLTTNARFFESFYTGGENYDTVNNRFEGQIRGDQGLITDVFAHTGSHAIAISPSDNTFGAVLRRHFHRAGEYKISVWVHKENYENARVKETYGGSLESFNGEKVFAGDWVQLNHYFEKTENTSDRIYMIASASDTIYIDDFRMHPIASSMNSYVYNEWDELSYILGENNLATFFKYDSQGRLEEVFTETVDAPNYTGGFKRTKEYFYNYKNQP